MWSAVPCACARGLSRAVRDMRVARLSIMAVVLYKKGSRRKAALYLTELETRAEGRPQGLYARARCVVREPDMEPEP